MAHEAGWWMLAFGSAEVGLWRRGTSDRRGDVYGSLNTHVNPHEPLVLNQTGIVVL